MDKSVLSIGYPITSSLELQRQLSEHNQLIQAIRAVNETDLMMLGEGTRLKYAMDTASRRPIVKVIDTATDAVLYQLPPEYVIDLVRQARREKNPGI